MKSITPDKKSIILEFTQFLNNTGKVPFRQRLWHFENNSQCIPVCATCLTNKVKWFEAGKCYRTYCSSKCAHNALEVRKKIETTCQERYGETTNLKCKTTQEKIRKTNLKKYGVDNPFKSPEIISKIKQTNLKKYGYTNPSKSDVIKNKIDKTNFQKYGKKRQSQSHIPQDIIDAKNNKELMKHWFYDLKMPVTEIAELLGVNHSQLAVHFSQNLNIDITRHSVSRAERELRQFIQQYETDVVFNDRTLIKPKELDIVIPSKKIAVELHGLAWHGERMGKNKNYHYDKYKLTADLGYELIQITDLEYLTKKNIVHSRILSRLGQNKTIYARKCNIRPIGTTIAANFLEKSHIQGYCISGIKLGLFFENELVSCMTFGKSRFNQKYQYELLRYSSKPYYNIVGGASKLFSHFVKKYNPCSVISYCDLRYGTGNMYLALGFQQLRETGPNYWYVKNGKTFENRMKYQKHKLPALLEKYDPELTEWENMQNNGYDRFWDCGNKVFIWNEKNG